MTRINSQRPHPGKSRITLIILIFVMFQAVSICLPHNFLYGQTVHVALPLANYSNNGTTPLSPAIPVTNDPSIDPPKQILLNDGVKDWIVLRDDQTITDLTTQLDWLRFRGSVVGSNYNIELFVAANKCAPRPVGQSNCGTECSAVTGFLDDPLDPGNPDHVYKCYPIKVTAFGNPMATHYLCVFGYGPLTITALGGSFSTLEVGDVSPDNVASWTAKRGSNLIWSLSAPADPLSITGLATNKAVTITANTMNPVAMKTVTLNVKGNNPNLMSNDACDLPATVSIPVSIKDPDVTPPAGQVDVVVVIDVSGSMGEKGACTPDGKGRAYDPSDFGSKMAFVKLNLAAIYKKIVEINKPPTGTRIGVITFADNPDKKLIGGKFFNPIGDPATDAGIAAIASGLTPTSSTNMGGALDEAIKELTANSTAPKKQIILITNGMQNGNKWVRLNKDGGAPYIDLNNNSVMDGGEAIPTTIDIFTIAIFQPSGDYLNLLKKISKNMRINDICTLNEEVDNAFAGTYRGNSPKNVGYRWGNFSGSSATINYTLSENEFDKIIVSLSSMRTTNLNFTFEKNIGGTWTNITSGGTIIPVASNYTMFSIAGLPKMVNGVNVTPQGEYRLVATSSKPGADYFSSAIVDDRGLKERTFIPASTIRAGDTFGLGARIRNNSIPVHQANATVIAIVHRPVASFEKLMADADVPRDKIIKSPIDREKRRSSIFKRYSLKPADGNTFEVGLPLIEQKYQILVYQKDFLGKLVWETDTVPLPEITNGVYQAPYSNTRVTGLYNVEYLLNGNVPITGAFFRTSAHSTPVLFGKPDRPKSNFYLFDESGSYYLNLKPVDIYGNYLGMGKGDQINITMSTGSSNEPLDYLDGRYVIPLNVPTNQNPFVVITIAGMEFYRGLLFNIPEKRFFIGIQGGITTPLGNFDTSANPGFMAGLKFGYRFSRKFGVLAEGAYFSFKDATHVNKDPNIFGGGIGLFYIPTSLPIAGGINIQLEATVGYYKPNFSDGKIGYRGGLDLSKFFHTWFSMSLNSSYYHIATKPDGTDFLGISLMAKFHF